MKQDWPEQHLETHTDCVRKPKAAASLTWPPNYDYVIMTFTICTHKHSVQTFCGQQGNIYLVKKYSKTVVVWSITWPFRNHSADLLLKKHLLKC